jgi:hypothetical protein
LRTQRRRRRACVRLLRAEGVGCGHDERRDTAANDRRGSVAWPLRIDRLTAAPEPRLAGRPGYTAHLARL